MVGTVAQARAAIAWGADGLIAQGREAGGHLIGTMAALDLLPHALAAAGGRPVFLAGASPPPRTAAPPWTPAPTASSPAPDSC